MIAKRAGKTSSAPVQDDHESSDPSMKASKIQTQKLKRISQPENVKGEEDINKVDLSRKFIYKFFVDADHISIIIFHT